MLISRKYIVFFILETIKNKDGLEQRIIMTFFQVHFKKFQRYLAQLLPNPSLETGHTYCQIPTNVE